MVLTGLVWCQQAVIPHRMKLRRRPRPSRWTPAFSYKATLQRAHADVHVNVLLQVRFSRPESEQARQRRIQSYEFLQKKQAEEPWVHLQYHNSKVGGALLPEWLQTFCLFVHISVSMSSSASGGSEHHLQAGCLHLSALITVCCSVAAGWSFRAWASVPVLPVSGRLRELRAGQNPKVSSFCF